MNFHRKRNFLFLNKRNKQDNLIRGFIISLIKRAQFLPSHFPIWFFFSWSRPVVSCSSFIYGRMADSVISSELFFLYCRLFFLSAAISFPLDFSKIKPECIIYGVMEYFAQIIWQRALLKPNWGSCYTTSKLWARIIYAFTLLWVWVPYKTGLIHTLSLVHFLKELMKIRFLVADAWPDLHLILVYRGDLNFSRILVIINSWLDGGERPM